MKQPLNSSDYNHYSLFDNMLEGVQVLDFDYRYVYLNDVVVNQAKSSHSDLINQKITAKFPGIDQSPMFQLLRTCMGQRIPQTFLNEFDHLDGSKGYFELRMQPVPEGVLILSIDETERYNTIHLLEQSNKRYKYVADASFDAIWDWDLISDIAVFGEGYRSIFGYDTNRMENYSIHLIELIHPDDRERILSTINCISEVDEKKWEIEYRFKMANGNYAHVLDRGTAIKNNEGKTVRIIGAKQDITQEKRSEQQKKILSEIGPIFNANKERLTGLQIILEKLVLYFDEFQLAEIWLIDSSKSKIELISKYSQIEGTEIFYENTSNLHEFRIGEGMPGTVWQTKEKTIWHDIQKNEKFLRRNAGIAINLNTVKGIPLLCKDEIIGALLLGSTYEIFEDKNNAIFYRGLSETLGSEIQRKHVEQELSEIFNTASDIICIAGFDGYYKKVNPYMCELLGYTEEELLSNPFLNFVHPDDIDITSNEAENLKFGESKLTFENRYKTKDGRIIWLSWTSKPNYDTNLIYAIAKDITEKKELEVLLKNSNKLAKNGSMEINFIENTAYYSEITMDILDLPIETIPYFGLGISFFKEGENRNKIESVIKDAMDNGVAWDEELEIITAKGNQKWIRTIGNSEFRNGKCARLFGSFQDITDKKKTEIELQTLNEVLEERALKLQQSNEELEQFAYVASHDLQEPLRMVTSFMSLLEKKYTDKLDDKGKEYIHFAVDGAKRMRQIILDLLEFSRVGRIREELDRIDLNILTQGILQFNREKIDEVGAIIRIENLPIIYSYETPVYQVLQNLVSNSLKYHSTTEQPIIDITVKEQENDWLFCIKDNGIGIDPAYHAKIFQLFQRLHTKNEYSGSGIGLSLCKKIIDDLKGKIWLESEENKGSAFYFTLPKLNEL